MKPLLLTGLMTLALLLPPASPTDERVGNDLSLEVERLAAANRQLRQQILQQAPRGRWVVIDTGTNTLRLMQDDRLLLETVVATGSGIRLEDPDGPRSWVFDTPRGEFTILEKITDPVWTRPDWAFIEAGEPIPTRWSDRFERNVLGDFALDLGEGYLIHGSLFERALGLHVTHGCIRVSADDLRTLFDSVRVGTRVFIL